MERRCVILLLAVSLVSGVVAAQTDEEIAAAITRLEGERLDARAMEFLIDAGEPAVGPLLAVLEAACHPAKAAVGPLLPVPEPADEDLRNPKFARVLCVLRAIGPEAGNACPALVQARIDDRSPAVQPSSATRFLFATAVVNAGGNATGRMVIPKWAIGASCHASLPGLLRRSELIEARVEGSDPPPALDGADVVEREFAADLLGPADRGAFNRLFALLEDKKHPTRVAIDVGETTFHMDYGQDLANAVVWDAAAKAIARIDPDHPKAVRGLALMVESADDPRVRVKAAMALGRHGDRARREIGVLLGALRSDDDRLVAEAVTALGMVGVASDVVLERLRALVSDDRPPR